MSLPRCLFLSLGAAFILLLPACASVRQSTPTCDLALANVHVVDVAAGEIRKRQTVRIHGGKIQSLASSESDRGDNCSTVLDVDGKYLSPGLNDSHIHLETNAFTEAFGMPPASIDMKKALALYLAHGVTGVRVLSGAPDILAFRDISAGGATPLLVVASPMLSGDPPVLPPPLTRIVTDPEDAEAVVSDYLGQGYDFIKIRGNLTPAVYEVVLNTAAAKGSYVEGHLTRSVGAFAALQTSQLGFAHLDEFAAGLGDDASFEEMAAAIAACDCFITSALSVTRSAYDQLRDYDGMFNRENMDHLQPLVVQTFWRKPNNPYFAQNAPVDFFETLNAKAVKLLIESVRAGAVIIAGTDAMNPMIIPGDSLHDELQMMVEGGLSPQDALKTATSNIADHVPGFELVGGIEGGRLANAVLTRANPLEDLGILRQPDAVIVNGHYLDRKTLEAALFNAEAD